MDSKVRRLTIFGMISVVLLIVVVVVFMNYDQLAGEQKAAAVTQEVHEEQSLQLEDDGKVKGADLSAFMKDETFFDHDQKEYAGVEISTGEQNTEEAFGETKVTLLATSVEKDLRIKIVDDNGKAIAGYDFLLDVDNVGTYQDLDKDGIVYVSLLNIKT